MLTHYVVTNHEKKIICTIEMQQQLEQTLTNALKEEYDNHTVSLKRIDTGIDDNRVYVISFKEQDEYENFIGINDTITLTAVYNYSHISMAGQRNVHADTCKQIMSELWQESTQSKRRLKYVICDVCQTRGESIEPYFLHYGIEMGDKEIEDRKRRNGAYMMRKVVEWMNNRDEHQNSNKSITQLLSDYHSFFN